MSHPIELDLKTTDYQQQLEEFLRTLGALEESCDFTATAVHHTREITGADSVLILRQLDQHTAEPMVCAPTDKLLGSVTTPEIFQEALLRRECMFFSSYPALPHANPLLLAWGVQSVAILPIHHRSFRGGILLLWKQRQEFSLSFVRFLQALRGYFQLALPSSQANWELERAQEQISAILETVPQGIIFVDDSGERGWINKEAARLLYLPPGPTVPHTISEAMHYLQTRAKRANGLQKNAEGVYQDTSSQIRNWIWILDDPPTQVLSVSSRVTQVRNVKGRVWVIDDITEHYFLEAKVRQSHDELEKAVTERTQELLNINTTLQTEIRERQQTESHLRDSEARKGALLETSLDPIVLVDHEGLILEFNPAAESVFRCSRNDVLGQSMIDLFSPPDKLETYRMLFRNHFQHSGMNSVGARFELTATAANARQFPVELAITPIPLEQNMAFAIYLRDITRRKNAERVLRDSETRFRLLVEALPEIVWSTSATGANDYFNSSWYNYTGLSSDKSHDAGWQDVFHPDDRPNTIAKWQHSVETGEFYTLEYRIRRYDGVYRWFLGRGIPIRNEQGQIERWLGTCVDIEQQKQAEQVLRRSHQDLEHLVEERTEELLLEKDRAESANRTKSEFLANMSHELRTPLNGVIGFAELLRDGVAGELNEQQEEFLDDILTSGRHLLQLINDILDLAKIEAGKMEAEAQWFSAGAVVSESVETLRGITSQSQIHVTTEVGKEAAFIHTDIRFFKQVLYNYLSNALKFTPPLGNVHISVRADGETAFRLDVEDSGVGISKENQATLFQQFHQVNGGMNKRYKGTGLGLALVKKMVELQGGEVGVDSTLGVGSRFWARWNSLHATQPPDGIIPSGGFKQ